jgi:hypothetical protein
MGTLEIECMYKEILCLALVGTIHIILRLWLINNVPIMRLEATSVVYLSSIGP